jgi:hypothetical protein
MPNFIRLSLWRFLLCLLPFGFAGVVFLLIYSNSRHGPLWDKYQNVQLGMTEQEVKDVLGSPNYVEYPGGRNGPKICTWVDGEEKLGVSFDTDQATGDDLVVDKWFWPQPLWEKQRPKSRSYGPGT